LPPRPVSIKALSSSPPINFYSTDHSPLAGYKRGIKSMVSQMAMLKRLLLTGLFTVILDISTTRGQTVVSLQECIDRALEQNLDFNHAKQCLKKILESVNEAAKVTSYVRRLQIMQPKEAVVYNVSATYYKIQTLTEHSAFLKENLESNQKLIS